jgi:hypothetical protein
MDVEEHILKDYNNFGILHIYHMLEVEPSEFETNYSRKWGDLTKII